MNKGRTNRCLYLAKGETPVPTREPTFDFEFVDKLHNLIVEGEAGWQKFFKVSRVDSFPQKAINQRGALSDELFKHIMVEHEKQLAIQY